MKSYVPLLDVLRFLAAFFVLVFHYFSASIHDNTNTLAIVTRYGFMGVELFFIISGFVIHISLKRGIADYALGRFLRLYPLFWVLCTITYLATVFFPDGYPLSFLYYLRNLLIINDGKTAFMVDGSYWTLTEEIFFYIYIGIFVYLFKRARLFWFYSLWLLFSFLTFALGLEHLLITKILLARYVPYFVYGGTLALLYEHTHDSFIKQIKYLLLLIAVIANTFFISYTLYQDPLPVTNFFGMFHEDTVPLMIAIFIMAPLAVYYSRLITHPRVLNVTRAMGAMTYPLYLLHQRLGALIIVYFGAVFGYVSATAIIVTIGMLMTSYVISVYEERWRKSIYQYIKSRVVSSH